MKSDSWDHKNDPESFFLRCCHVVKNSLEKLLRQNSLDLVFSKHNLVIPSSKHSTTQINAWNNKPLKQIIKIA